MRTRGPWLAVQRDIAVCSRCLNLSRVVIPACATALHRLLHCGMQMLLPFWPSQVLFVDSARTLAAMTLLTIPLRLATAVMGKTGCAAPGRSMAIMCSTHCLTLVLLQACCVARTLWCCLALCTWLPSPLLRPLPVSRMRQYLPPLCRGVYTQRLGLCRMQVHPAAHWHKARFSVPPAEGAQFAWWCLCVCVCGMLNIAPVCCIGHASCPTGRPPPPLFDVARVAGCILPCSQQCFRCYYYAFAGAGMGWSKPLVLCVFVCVHVRIQPPLFQEAWQDPVHWL